MKLHKYVIAVDGEGLEHALVFEEAIQHRSAVPQGMQAVSAGFVLLAGADVVVPGHGSESLGLNPRPADREILKEFLKA